MANINEIGSANGMVYGVKFLICANSEVIGQRTISESDPSGNGWASEAAEAASAAAEVIFKAGYDYERVSDFRAYNGGPRKLLVDALVYGAELLIEDGEEVREEWEEISAADLPTDLSKRVDLLADEAAQAMQAVMEAALVRVEHDALAADDQD